MEIQVESVEFSLAGIRTFLPLDIIKRHHGGPKRTSIWKKCLRSRLMSNQDRLEEKEEGLH